MRRLIAALALSLCAAAPPAAIDPARLSEHVRVLASDAFEGRFPGTPGETKSVDYIVAQMKAAGLQPGAAGSWTQAVPLIRSEIVGAPKVTLTVGDRAASLVQGQDVAIIANQTGLAHVSIKDAPLVFVGYGVTAPERTWDDFKGVDLKGKIAVILVNDPDFETGVGDFGGKAMTYYGRWTYKFEEAARRGAAGALVIHETAPAAYGWATVKTSNTGPVFDIARKDPGAVHTPMDGWIAREAAVDLFTRAGLDFEAQKIAARSRDFRPVVLAGASLSADYAVARRTVVSKNVVGRIPGAARPKETVIYSAHWDHFGVGAPDARGDRIYNGAMDNADGVAALLEIARLQAARPRPARSVLFLAVTAEEQGLLGSQYYAANPLYPMATTVADLNMDALDADGPAKDVGVSGVAQLDLIDDLAKLALARGRSFSPDPAPEAGRFYRSDHFSFAKRGVPAISLSSGRDLVDGGRAAGDAWKNAYVAQRYHQPSDEWSPDMNLKGVAADVGLFDALGWSLANSTDWPGWGAGSEFKAEREKTAAQRR